MFVWLTTVSRQVNIVVDGVISASPVPRSLPSSSYTGTISSSSTNAASSDYTPSVTGSAASAVTDSIETNGPRTDGGEKLLPNTTHWEDGKQGGGSQNGAGVVAIGMAAVAVAALGVVVGLL